MLSSTPLSRVSKIEFEVMDRYLFEKIPIK